MAIHQPHDHLFKRVFGAPAEAASFLQARLPARLCRSLHWPTLKRRSASFVTPDLRGTASDREGRLEGQREGRLETIDGFLRAGVAWLMIKRATGIGEREYRKLKRQPNGAAAAGGDGT